MLTIELPDQGHRALGRSRIIMYFLIAVKNHGTSLECYLSQAKTDTDTRARDVLEMALSAVVKCLPGVAGAEVWQVDTGGTIRCILDLVAASELSRPNMRIDHVLREEDLEAIRRDLKLNPRQFCAESDLCPIGDSPKETHLSSSPSDADAVVTSSDSNRGRILRISQMSDILAVTFHDPCFKVGKSWVGADRLARGFALVARLAGASERAQAEAGTSSCRLGSSPSNDLPGSEAGVGERIGGTGDVGEFLAEVAAEVQAALTCVRDRERQERVRALALSKVTAVCSSEGAPGAAANDAVLAEVSSVLPGCCAYVGILEPGGKFLQYKAATPNSSMLHRRLYRGEGISINILDRPNEGIRVLRYLAHRPSTAAEDPKPPVPVGEPSTDEQESQAFIPGTVVDVWYASSWLAATLLGSKGHGFFDVRYEVCGETEAGVPWWRLRHRVIDYRHVKIFQDSFEAGSGEQGKIDLRGDSGHLSPRPFACVPLRCGGNRVGVLGVDGWSGARIGLEEDYRPEGAILAFLKSAGTLLASVHYEERRRRAIFALDAALRTKDATEEGAFEALIVLLGEAVMFRKRIDILESRASEPWALYRRARWVRRTMDSNSSANGRHIEDECLDDSFEYQEQFPVQYFEATAAPREEELCITPAQYMELAGRRAPVLSPREPFSGGVTTGYQQEIHQLVLDGSNSVTGSHAKALGSRPGEIVSRFQRFVARSGSYRPSSDGWYLVRIARDLPELAGYAPTASAEVGATQKGGVLSEEGDISLLSDMSKKLEAGLMVLANREQGVRTRAKALGRVEACCKEVSVGALQGKRVGLGPRRYIPSVSGVTSFRQWPAAPGCSNGDGTFGIPGLTPSGFELAPRPSAAEATSAILEGRTLMFSEPLTPPIPAETPDGRKGTLVALRDGRLGVLVQHGAKKMVEVELPNGKREIISASEVGQLVGLQ